MAIEYVYFGLVSLVLTAAVFAVKMKFSSHDQKLLSHHYVRAFGGATVVLVYITVMTDMGANFYLTSLAPAFFAILYFYIVDTMGKWLLVSLFIINLLVISYFYAIGVGTVYKRHKLSPPKSSSNQHVESTQSGTFKPN